jgi:two-component system, OmpR family, phosphate regulon response regulator PhoB
MNQARKVLTRPNTASVPRILIVEDDSDIALLLAYNLEAEGYVVESVERGDEVELRLAERAPDLVCCPGYQASKSARGCGRARIRALSRSSW